jgi:hypothetical protein
LCDPYDLTKVVGMPLGRKFGGRKKGTPNKVTLQRAAVMAEDNKKTGRRGMVDIMRDLANQHYQLALAYVPHRDRSKDDPNKPQFPERLRRRQDRLATDSA